MVTLQVEVGGLRKGQTLDPEKTTEIRTSAPVAGTSPP
jgi:hypothetical protein